MRKVVIIGLLLLAIWFAAMPALVGFYLRDAVPGWLNERSASAAAVYQSGWFTSRLELRPDPDTQLNLTARHAPVLKPGWLALRGQLQSPFTPKGAGVRTHLGLTGSWHLSAESEIFSPSGRGEWIARNLALNVAQVAGQPVNLTARADQIELPGQTRPLDRVRARGFWRDAGKGLVRLGLDLQASDPELGPLALTLQIGPVAPEQLELLTQGLAQLAQGQPGSVTEGMALMTIAGAWQQMAGEGLTIQLERLQFGEQTAFEGAWTVADNTPTVVGSGDITALNRWWDRLAPAMQAGPGQGPLDVIDLLSQVGEVRVEDRHFRFSLPAYSALAPQHPGPGQAP